MEEQIFEKEVPKLLFNEDENTYQKIKPVEILNREADSFDPMEHGVLRYSLEGKNIDSALSAEFATNAQEIASIFTAESTEYLNVLAFDTTSFKTHINVYVYTGLTDATDP